MIVPDLFAIHADRDSPLQGLDLSERRFKILCGLQ